MKPVLKRINHVFFVITTALIVVLYPFMLFEEFAGAGVIDRLFASFGIADGFSLMMKIAYGIFIPWLISLFLKIKVFKD